MKQLNKPGKQGVWKAGGSSVMMLGVFCWSQQGPHVNLESIFKGANIHRTCYRPLCLPCFLQENDVQMKQSLFQELLANFQLLHWHLHTVDFSSLKHVWDMMQT